jgi:hypothetical protein
MSGETVVLDHPGDEQVFHYDSAERAGKYRGELVGGVFALVSYPTLSLSQGRGSCPPTA